MYYIYVLRSEKTERLYTGSCENVDRRLREHNSGQSKATRHGVPWHLVYTESFDTRSEAMQRELFLKTGKGRAELRRLTC